MKAKSLTLMLSHYETGRWREINQWHNGLHRIELHGMVPGVYHSQDYVASPDDIAAWPANELKWSGGEMLSMYWSEGTPEELDEGVRTISEQNRKTGIPPRGPGGQELTWRRRMHVLGAQTRSGLLLAPDMVPLAPSTGVALTISEIGDEAHDAYLAWNADTYLTRVLKPELFAAAFQLSPMGDERDRVFAHLLFTEHPDPLAAFKDAAQIALEITSPAVASGRLIFCGVYRPVTEGQAFYD
jgi:hypothetical protein